MVVCYGKILVAFFDSNIKGVNRALAWKIINETLCAIWYYLYNFKNVKDNHEAVLLLVKLQAGFFATKVNG